MGNGEPGRVCNACRVHQSHQQCQNITRSDTDQDGNQLHHPAAENRYDGGNGKGKAGKNQRIGIVDDLFAVRLTHCHAACRHGNRQTDDHDDGADDDRRQQFVYRCQSAPTDQRGKHKIHKAGGKQSEHGGRQPPFADGVDNRCDKGKRRTKKNRHFAFGCDLEQQRSQACAQKRKSRIQTGQQGNQHHCAECHK